MIRRISLTNYGPFASAELELAPLTVVVGPNASGKSKLLELFNHLSAADEYAYLVVFQLMRDMRKKGCDGHAIVVVEARDGSQLVVSTKLGGDVDRKSWKVPLRTVFLRLSHESLRSPSRIDSEHPLIREDGYGLATNLAFLKLNDIDIFNRLLEQTREIIPAFENLRFKQPPVTHGKNKGAYGHGLGFDMKSAPDLTPDAVSAGTLLTLGLLTGTLEFTRRHKAEAGYLLFLIDDLERGLHPRALAELVAQLRRLTETTGAQILSTSHSPYLLDALRPEEVRLTGFLEDGSVTIKPLTDHPDFERWKDEMMPGEFWSMVGEDWIK